MADDDKNIDIDAMDLDPNEFLDHPDDHVDEPAKPGTKGEYLAVLMDPNLDKDIRDLPPEEKPETPVVIPPIEGDPKEMLLNNIPQHSPLNKALNLSVDNDPLVSAVKRKAPLSSLLDAVMLEIAEEAAFIKMWRNENYDMKADLSEATAKRVKMLSSLVETIAEREKAREKKEVGKIDFYSENFQRIFEYFINVIKNTFKEVGIPDQYFNIFFPQIARAFDGFEKKAEKLYYGKDKK